MAFEQYIKTWDALQKLCAQWRLKGDVIVFTNGCFDLIHSGHLKTLKAAASFGDRLIVGINSDASVKRLKGEGRPIKGEEDRALVMASIKVVDAVGLFEEDNPLRMIEALMPDVLVKGGDWKVEEIVGSEWVLANGGSVHSVPLVEGKSTSGLVKGIDEDGQF